MEDKNKIGAFFNSQLSDHQEEISLLDLEMMSTRMSPHNFMKFNLLNFNIYYAVAICSGFLITLTLGGHYLNTYKRQENMLEETRKELALLKTEIQDHKLSHHTTYPKDAVITVPNSPSGPTQPTTRENKGLSQPPNSLLFKNKKDEHSTIKAQQNAQLNKANLYEDAVPTGATTNAPVLLNEKHTHTSKTVPEQLAKPNEDLGSKKKVIIYKRDTIYQYDTLKVKKKNQ